MQKVTTWGMAIVLALGVIGTAWCAEPSVKSGTSTKTGTVKKVDVDGKQIVVMVTRELTFTTTAETRIVQGDAAKTLADIKPGDTVTVDYTRADPQTRLASKIVIAAPAVAKPAAPAKPE